MYIYNINIKSEKRREKQQAGDKKKTKWKR